MTDNGAGHVSRPFGKACRMLRLRPIRTRPNTPKTNGKAARVNQTLLRAGAHALPYRRSDRRAADRPGWLRHHNHERPPPSSASIKHASLARRSPAAWLHAPA